MRNRHARSESAGDALVRAIARHGTTRADGERFAEQLARGGAKARERADDGTNRNEDARDGYRAIAELGAILGRAIGVPVPSSAGNDRANGTPGNSDPVVALSVPRARLGAYARSDPVDRTIVFPGARAMLPSRAARQNARSWAVIKRYVERGIGICVVPSICLHPTDQVSVIALNNYFHKRSFGVYTRRGKVLTAPARRLLGMLISTRSRSRATAPR